jgi:hypothetical protein
MGISSFLFASADNGVKLFIGFGIVGGLARARYSETKLSWLDGDSGSIVLGKETSELLSYHGPAAIISLLWLPATEILSRSVEYMLEFVELEEVRLCNEERLRFGAATY